MNLLLRLAGLICYPPLDTSVDALAKPVLRHRILVNYRAEAEGVSVDTVIDKLLADND